MYYSLIKNILLITCISLAVASGHAQDSTFEKLFPELRYPFPHNSVQLGALRVGNGVNAPTLLQFALPVYPKKALEEHRGGTALLWIVVAPDGRCREAKIARSLGG